MRHSAVAPLAVGLALLILLAAGGSAGYREANRLQASLAGDLQVAAAEMDAGKAALKEANSKHDLKALNNARQHFKNAKLRFDLARKSVDGNVALVAADWVPGVGQLYVAPRHHAVDAIATMGLALVDAGEQAIEIDANLMAPSGAPSQESGPQRVLTVLRDASNRIGRIEADLKTAREADQSIDVTVLPAGQQATFSHARDSILKGLQGIAQFRSLVPALLELLGNNGPRTYLVEQADPADLRGGGGFIGSFSLVLADRGVMKIQTTADVATIEWPPYVMPGMKTPIKPPNPLQEFADHPWVFGDSNFDPNFPGTARDGELTFFNQTGKRVDGVISLDPWAIALLLTATGPLRLPEYSATVDGATFPEDVFQREQAHPNDPEFARTRKQFLAAVAKNLIERLTALPADQWTKVIDAMNTAVTQKHLQVYFNDATAQSGMANFGWAGQLIGASSQQEFLMEVESNFGATKANHFMQRRYDLKLVAEGATLKHNLTVTLKNSTPTGYVNGRYYRVYVRVYVPANATGLSAQNLFRDRLPTQEQQKGLALMDGWWQVNVDPRLGYGTSTFIFSWNTPLSGDAGHSIYWQKQSGTLSDAITVSYTAGGHTTTAQTDLTQDRLLALTPNQIEVRAGTGGGAQLPTLGF